MTPRDDFPTSPLSASTPEPSAALFKPDDVVAGRYRIVRFIAQGGMGEVYETEDLELKERVALKTIRPEIARDPRAIERFKREILLARRVTHPGVSRTFDFGQHDTGTAAAVTFLTMELLRGETLLARLRRAGPMKKDEALPLVVQMAAALAAAHGAGIVHRDFKSANVMLVPQGEEPARAVVTDFGLARSHGRPADVTASELGSAGTPAYMAPEQVEGGTITPAADIYALGVVMYEMATGRLPFTAETPLAVAARRLTERPTPPRVHVPDLDPTWEKVILRCLEREPAGRFRGADDVAAALGGERIPDRPRGLRAVWVVGAVLAAALAAGIVIQRSRFARPAAPATVVTTPTRRAVAVLGFKNLSARTEAAWLSTALSEMLTTELAAGESLRTIPGENVARMKADLAVDEAESLAPATLAKIRGVLGADVIVLGSYLCLGPEAGGQIRLDLRIQDAAAGETLASVAEKGTESELFDLVARTGGRLREKLGLAELSPGQSGAVRAARPANAEAARSYSEGLAKLRLFDARAARERLATAVAQDPRFALAHAALAEAWSALGYDGRARAAARRALELSAGLSREDRLAVEGRSHEFAREWDKAAEVFGTLWGFFPDNLEYGLHLAQIQAAAGRGKDALATIEALRKLPSPAREDARIDLAEAAAAFATSDFKRDQAAARIASSKGAAGGARLLVARGRLAEGMALHNMGESKPATAALEEAKAIFEAAGDQAGAAQAGSNIGLVLWREGDIDGAKRRFEQALVVARTIGSKSGEARALNNIAIVAQMRGDVATARKLFEQTAIIYRETGNVWLSSTALNNLGVLHHRVGDLAPAKHSYEEAVTASREAGRKDTVALATSNIAWVLWLQGDLAGAQRKAEDALALAREIHSKSLTATSAWNLGQVLASQGALPAARMAFDEALKLQDEVGERGYGGQTRVSLATLAIEEGRFADAEAWTRAAEEEFRKEKAHDLVALALAIRARALLAEGRTAEARALVDEAQPLSRKIPRRDVPIIVGTVAGRVLTAQGAHAEAGRLFDAAQADAASAGLLGLVLETRLARAELERAAGNEASARAALQDLERDATAKGYGSLARRAAAARRATAGR